MAANDIQSKLQLVVLDGSFSQTEMGAVYFLVELRKLLEMQRIDIKKFPILKFYCDWVVHTRKDRFLETINPFLDSLEREIKGEINNDWKKFINFLDFEDDLYRIAAENILGLDINTLKTSIKDFERNLGQVLKNQPIETNNHFITKVEIVDIRELQVYFQITAKISAITKTETYASVYNKERLIQLSSQNIHL